MSNPSCEYCLSLLRSVRIRNPENSGSSGSVAQTVAKGFQRSDLARPRPPSARPIREIQFPPSSQPWQRDHLSGPFHRPVHRQAFGSRRHRFGRRWPIARPDESCSRARGHCHATDWLGAAVLASSERGRAIRPLASAYFREKWSANSRISSGRSRRGGKLEIDDIQPIEQILAKAAIIDGFGQVPGSKWQ